MTVHVTGYRPIKFTDEKTGEIIEGTNVYYLHDDIDTTGRVATKKFFRESTNLPELVIGTDYIMEYGPNGKLQSFTLAGKKA